MQRLDHVPTGAIQHQHHVTRGADLFAEHAQVLTNMSGGDRERVNGGQLTGLRIDRAEQIAPGVRNLLDRRRPSR